MMSAGCEGPARVQHQLGELGHDTEHVKAYEPPWTVNSRNRMPGGRFGLGHALPLSARPSGRPGSS
jgi:hypothetical protein